MTDGALIDIGAQAERTALAWQRTAIGLLANGALLCRWSFVEHVTAWPAVVLTAGASLALLVVAPMRYRRIVGAVRGGRNPLSRTAVPALTVLFIVAVALCVAQLSSAAG